MLFDILNRYKLLLKAQFEYPKFLSMKMSLYRYVMIFGLTNKIRYQKKDYYMVFGDYENEPIDELKIKIRKAIDDHKLNMVLIFQSSKDKYHFIAPKMLDSFAESIHVSKELGSHKEYLNFSALKGVFALRLTRKHHKDEPELIGCIFGTKIDKEAMVSADFVRLMELNYRFNENNFDFFKRVDAELEYTKYNTYNL